MPKRRKLSRNFSFKMQDKAEEKSIAYLKTDIQSYALTQPIVTARFPEPKNFLVLMGPKKVEEHKEELIPTEVDCIETATGARFCVFRFEDKEISGMEMCRPIFEMKYVIKKGRMPTIEECRRERKNDFLVVKCKPEEFCKGGES